MTIGDLSATIYRVDSLIKKYKVVANYIKVNPNSYVALWSLIFDYNRYGYSKYFENVLELFSPKLKLLKPYKT